MKQQGKGRVLRIHFSEDDRWQGKPLYQAILDRCLELDMDGATVLRGSEGYGPSTLARPRHFLSLSSDRPVMVSVVDSEAKILALLPAIEGMVSEGLIDMAEVEYIRYSAERGS